MQCASEYLAIAFAKNAEVSFSVWAITLHGVPAELDLV
jgi:hypothetical protein